MHSSWDDLRFLEALERLGSARAAGRELGVAPSTIYRRITALEGALGLACLDRGRGITAAARELAQLARASRTSMDSIVRRGRVAHAEIRGKITLTTIDGFAPLLVAPLADLAEAHPALEVEVQVSESGGPSLSKRQAEVGLTIVDRPPGALIGRKLMAIRWAVYGSSRFTGDPQAARWVVLGDPHRKTWLGQWEAKYVPKERIALATASRRLFIDLVAGGVGLGLLPCRLAENDEQLSEVAWQPKSLPKLTRSAWLLWHPELRTDARVLALVRALTKHLGD